MALSKREAIAEAQRYLGVTADGIWGPKTQAAYSRASAGTAALVGSSLDKAELTVPKIVAYQKAGGDATKQVFNQQVIPEVLRLAKERGLNGHVMVAQMKLETGGGGRIPPQSNNWAGIKARAGEASVIAGTTEVVGGVAMRVKEPFRKYATPEEFAGDYVARLATSKRYSAAYKQAGVAEAARAIAKAGYATDPNYATKLAQVASSIQSA